MRAQILIFAFAGVVLASLAALSATKKDGQAILDNWTIFLRGNPYDEAASEPEQIANRVEHSTSTPVKKPSTNDASVKSVRVPLLNDSVCRVPLLDDTVYRVPLLDDTAQQAIAEVRVGVSGPGIEIELPAHHETDHMVRIGRRRH